MIKVYAKVKLNMPRINKLTRAASIALEQTAEALRSEVVQAQVVPRMDGVLLGESTNVTRIHAGESVITEYEDGTKVINSITHEKGGAVSIVTTAPQARRLYYHPEYDFHKGPWEEDWTDKDGKKHHLTHEGNPNAKGRWFEDWEEGGKHADYAAEAFKKIYRRLAGL